MSQFQKGQSGNPTGRKPGTGYASKLRTAIEDDIPEILEAVVSSAKNGDMTAAKMLLDRTIPPLKPSQEVVTVRGAKGSLVKQSNAVISAMVQGQVSPDTGQAFLSALANQAKILEVEELQQRIEALEEALEE